eukprot:g1004.t1
MPNKLAKQTLSTHPEDHSFKLYKDQTFKAVVKTGGYTAKSAPKLKPNDNCDCGSGKKHLGHDPPPSSSLQTRRWRSGDDAALL